jgi:hypothetical protein
VQREGRARDPLEPQVRILGDQARIDLLVTDQQDGLVPARAESLSQGNARREVPTRAAARDKEPAHCARPPRPPGAADPRIVVTP